MLLSKSQILDMIKHGKLIQNSIDLNIQVQQCGVDLTAGKVFKLVGNGQLDFSNEKRKLPDYEEISTQDNKWKLKPGLYHIGMNEKITLSNNIAGLLLPRSSALCCGLEIHSALWDPGYEGRSFIHASLQKNMTLFKNARIAQMIFFLLENTEKYNGQYKHEDILKKGKRG